MVAYTKLNRRPPAEADFQRYFEVTPPSVHTMIITLERRGLSRAPRRQVSMDSGRDGSKPMLGCPVRDPPGIFETHDEP